MILKNKKGFIFDLDGVITSTADLHFEAWSKAAEKVGITLDESVEPKLRGVDRTTSLEIILSENNKVIEKELFDELLIFKNDYFIKLLDNLNESHIIDGMKQLLVTIKEKGYATALASTSKNAPYILEKLMIKDLFDTIVDPSKIENQKPSPDIFIEAAKSINTDVRDCIVFEDAQAGIDGSNSAGIEVIAYEPVGSELVNATYKLTSFKDLLII